jgi:thiol-disulfide isomerase/thioredoxin
MPKSFFYLFLVFLLLSCHKPETKLANGQPFEWSDSTSVYFFLNTECPLCNRLIGRFSFYQKQYPHVKFYYVFYDDHNTESRLSFLRSDSIIPSQIIIDSQLQIYNAFKPDVTPKVVVAQNKNILYSGLLDDRFTELGVIQSKIVVDYLSNALNSLMKNEPIKDVQTKAVGCFIEPM